MIKYKNKSSIKKILVLFLLVILIIDIEKIYLRLYILIIIKRDITQTITLNLKNWL